MFIDVTKGTETGIVSVYVTEHNIEYLLAQLTIAIVISSDIIRFLMKYGLFMFFSWLKSLDLPDPAASPLLSLYGTLRHYHRIQSIQTSHKHTLG